jgi:hypothetical protein
MKNVVIKKIDLERDFVVGVYLSEAQSLIPPPFTHCVRLYIQYNYSHREGGRRRVEPE